MGKNVTNAFFTLGSYTAYIRSPYTKNIRYPYTDYLEHWIVGFIYDRIHGLKPEIIDLGMIESIKAPVKNVEVIVWQKWQIASDKPGSGNTANIGSVHNIEKLRNGKGKFTGFGSRGKDVFEEYWRNFDWKIPRKYTNLDEYKKWKKMLPK